MFGLRVLITVNSAGQVSELRDLFRKSCSAAVRPTNTLHCDSQGPKGTPTDKLRLALVFLLTCEALPSDGDYERVTAALAAAGTDTSALAYVRRMRRLNLTGRAVCGTSDFSAPGTVS